MLAIKMIQKEKKLKHLRAVGHWRKIYNSLKKYEYMIYNERKVKKMKLYCVWAKLSRNLLQRHYKEQSLQNIGRWKNLIKGIKN